MARQADDARRAHPDLPRRADLHRYLYDDYGPNLNRAPDFPQFRDNLAPKSGDYGYPNEPDRYGYNATDLRELRLAADRNGDLHALIGLQTMKVPDATIVEIAIDTDGATDPDGAPSTGTANWPYHAGLQTRGADRLSPRGERGPGSRIRATAPIRCATE